jgi:hypothetical protein
MKKITVLPKNCTRFSVFILFFSLCFLSCQTTQYHQPIKLTQDEIKSMVVHDANGMTTKIAPGKVRDCVTMKAAGAKNCAYILCREDQAQSTGLSCEYFIPMTAANDVLAPDQSTLAAKKSSQWQTQIDDMIKEFESGKKQPLENFCGKDTVVCYFKSKPYPLNKHPSSALLSTLVHKESMTTKEGDSFEISVFND